MGTLISIFFAFLIPAIVGFGGGPASLAIINSAVVDTFGIISQSDMNMIISFSNALPGPIATLLALGVGYYSAGIVGGIVALIALMVPSCVLIIILYNFLMKHKTDYRVKRITKYILPLIVIMFVQLSINFVLQSFNTLNTYVVLLIMGVSAITILKFKIHPVYLIGSSMLIGYFIL